MKSLKEKKKKSKDKQQALKFDNNFEVNMGGMFYRFRKIEALLEVSPFWRSSFVWFALSLDVFVHIMLFIYMREKVVDLPGRIPFLFIYPEGERQLMSPVYLWYFAGGSVILSIINTFWAGKLYAADRHEAKYLLSVNIFKTLLFAGIIYKLFMNWL